jgi:predicted PurR-regulated permease PerM
MKMMEQLVTHLANVERTTQVGIKTSHLINWYLEEMENEFQTLEDLERERELVEKVLVKLIKVSFFLPSFYFFFSILLLFFFFFFFMFIEVDQFVENEEK